MFFTPPCPNLDYVQTATVTGPCTIANEPIEVDLHHEERRDFDPNVWAYASQSSPVVTGAIFPNAGSRNAQSALDPELLKSGNEALKRWWLSKGIWERN